MRKINFFSKVSKNELLDLEDILDEDNWRSKAEQLQMRRWRKLRNSQA